MWNRVRGDGQAFLVVFFLAASFLAGCSEEPKPPAKPALERLSLQLQWVTQAQFAGYYVALEKGWYRDEGINLTIKPGMADVNPPDLVSSGIRDFGTAILADLTVAIQKGKPLVSIGQIQQANGLILISRKSSGIKKPGDFIGKRVGIWLGAFEVQFNALMAREKIPVREVQVMSQGWSMDGFLKGDLDVASAMIYNEYHVVLESGLKPEDIIIIDYEDYGLGFPGDTLFTSRKLTAEKPDLCLRMLRASLKGWQYALQHPEEAVDIVLKYDTSGVQKREHQLVMMKEIARLVGTDRGQLGRTDKARVARTIEMLQQCSILTCPLRPEDVYTNEFREKMKLEY